MHVRRGQSTASGQTNGARVAEAPRAVPMRAQAMLAAYLAGSESNAGPHPAQQK